MTECVGRRVSTVNRVLGETPPSTIFRQGLCGWGRFGSFDGLEDLRRIELMP